MEKKKLTEVEQEILDKVVKKLQDDPEIPDSIMELLDFPANKKPKSMDDVKKKSQGRLKEIQDEEMEGDNMHRKPE